MTVQKIAASRIRRLAAFLASEKIPSISLLAKLLRVSRPTVRKYRKLIQETGYSCADFMILDPREMQDSLNQYNMHKGPDERFSTLLTVFPQIHANVSEGTANLRQTWTEYRKHHQGGYGYSQFAAHFLEWRKT